MSKRCFIPDTNLTPKSIEYLKKINPIIDYYNEIDHKLTLRQLHYQTVTKGFFLNNEKTYKKLSRELTKGRMAGEVDWDVIEDRLRQVQIPYYSEDIAEAIQSTANLYRIDRMRGQKNYVEVWVEKDALSGVLSRITRAFHIPLMVNRGFSSTSAMYDSAIRFTERIENGQHVILIYIGDHDPSGLFMFEDIQKRLSDFGLTDIEYHRVGLTLEQVEEYDLIPNAVKESDKRHPWYLKTTGCNASWEVDALDPLVLDQILVDEITKYINVDLFNETCEQEKREKNELKSIASNYAYVEAV